MKSILFWVGAIILLMLTFGGDDEIICSMEQSKQIMVFECTNGNFYEYPTKKSSSGIVMKGHLATYTVQQGDSFKTLANKFYGESIKYGIIFRANADMMIQYLDKSSVTPDDLTVGMVIIIPALVEPTLVQYVDNYRRHLATYGHSDLIRKVGELSITFGRVDSSSDDPEKQAIATCEPHLKRILIDPALATGCLEFVVYHELTHCVLQFRHTDRKEDLMSKHKHSKGCQIPKKQLESMFENLDSYERFE